MTTIKVVFTSHDIYFNRLITHSGTLTPNKIYEATFDETEPVYSSTGLYYKIVNDLGKSQEYYSGHFTELNKFRDIQMMLIGLLK